MMVFIHFHIMAYVKIASELVIVKGFISVTLSYRVHSQSDSQIMKHVRIIRGVWNNYVFQIPEILWWNFETAFLISSYKDINARGS